MNIESDARTQHLLLCLRINLSLLFSNIYSAFFHQFPFHFYLYIVIINRFYPKLNFLFLYYS